MRPTTFPAGRVAGFPGSRTPFLDPHQEGAGAPSAPAPAANTGTGTATATRGATPTSPSAERRQAIVERTTVSDEDRSAIAELIAANQELTQGIRSLMGLQSTVENLDGRVTQELQRLDNERQEVRRDIESIATNARRSLAEQPSVSDVMPEGQTFSVARCAAAAYFGWKGPLESAPERKALQAWEDSLGVRALPHDTTATGQLAITIPPVFMEDYIERLSARTVAFTLGARFLNDLGGAPVEWPRVIGGATAEWVNENEEPTDSEVAMGSLRMSPKELACSAPITKRLLLLSGGRAGDVLEEDMARAMAETLDLGIISGDGGESSPLGITNVSGVGQTDFSSDIGAVDIHGADSNIVQYLDLMVAKVDSRNAYGGRMGWAAHPLTLNKIRRAKDLDGRPLFLDTMNAQSISAQGNAIGTGRGFLHGHPVATTTNLTYGAASDLILGDWTQVLVGGWGALTIEVSDNYSDYFKRRRLLILMTQLVDAGLRHPEAFEIATAFNAAGLT